MSETIIREGNRATVKPTQRFTASLSEQLKPELKDLVDQGVAEVIFDLLGVDDIDSISIGLIVSTHNSLKKLGGVVRVINVCDDIISLFKTMRLDQHFTIQGVD
ncbi:MAG TPA: STAS domain-containing protein [bacterium]|nr:STAS domain-containing protein [bacterium]